MGTFKTKGFTLIELLAAMGVLSIMLLVMAQIFAQVSLGFKNGRESLMEVGEGSTVFNIIAKDLEYMLVSTNFTMYKDKYDPRSISKFGEFDKITFITANGRSSKGDAISSPGYTGFDRIARDVQMVGYALDAGLGSGDINDFGDQSRFNKLRKLLPKESGRGGRIGVFNARDNFVDEPGGEDASWFDEDNFGNMEMSYGIVRFDIYLYSWGDYGRNPSAHSTGTYADRWLSSDDFGDTVKFENDKNAGPAYIELFMQLASEDAWIRANNLGLDTQDGFEYLNNESRVFFKRVFPVLAPSNNRHKQFFLEHEEKWFRQTPYFPKNLNFNSRYGYEVPML